MASFAVCFSVAESLSQMLQASATVECRHTQPKQTAARKPETRRQRIAAVLVVAQRSSGSGISRGTVLRVLLHTSAQQESAAFPAQALRTHLWGYRRGIPRAGKFALNY